MWLGYYLVPPTQALGSLYKAVSATEPRRSSLVLRQFRATRTMRKTRLVILPGVRSITQIGCLLLFLACPSIAFKGQEKRDVEPMCKFHELKYWWLPFDTGEGENSTITQHWTGYQCQVVDLGKMKGNDNVTDSVQNSCRKRIISHGLVIPGQDANYNFERNRMRVSHSLPSSATTNMSSLKNSFSNRRTIVRNDFPQKMYKRERIFEVFLEKRVSFYNYQPITSLRPSRTFSDPKGIDSRIRTVVQNRLQRNSREGPETKGVNERRHSNPSSGRWDIFHATRESFRVNPKFNLQRYIGINEKDSSRRIRSDILRESRKENGENILPLQDTLRRQSSPDRLEGRETTRRSTMTTIQPKDFKKQSRMDWNLVRAVTIENYKRFSDKSPHILVSHTFSLDRRMNEYNLRRNPGTIEKDNTRMIRSEAFRESRNEIREHIPLLQNTLRRQNSPAGQERRETTRRSGIPISQEIDSKEHSRMDRRLKRDASIGLDKHLSDRRSTRSRDSRAFSLDRRIDENNLRRDTGVSRKDSTRRIAPEISRESRNEIRENISQFTLRRQISQRLERRATTEGSEIPTIQSKDFNDQSRIDRRLQRVVFADNERRLSNKRSIRSVDSRIFSNDRKMEEHNLRRVIRTNERDSTRKIRAEITRESINEIRENISPLQNTLGRQNSQERRENIQRLSVTIIHPENFQEHSRMNRRLERFVSIDNVQHLSDRRRSMRSTESRVFSLDKRMAEYNVKRETRRYEKDSVRWIRSDISRESRRDIRENTLLNQNALQQSSPERRETTRRSVIAINRSKEFQAQSRMDNRLEGAVVINNEQRLSEKRSGRSFESPVHSQARKMAESNIRQNIGINEKDSSRRIMLRISRGSRKEILENILLLQNTLRSQSIPARLERREITKRSQNSMIQSKDLRIHSGIGRRLKRAATIDNNIHLSNRRSTSSLDSQAFTLDRRINEYNHRRDTGVNEKDSTRMIRSEIFRESRNEIRENIPRLQNTFRRQSSPDRLEGRETTRRSGIPISQAINFKDHSRMDRRLERAASFGSDKRLSDRRSTRSLDSRAFSLDRRMNEYTLRRETGINEKDSTRMIRSEIFRESRNEIRENVPRLQNTLRRQSSPDRLEGRETTRRSGIPISQAINFKDHTRMDRRLERAASFGSDKRLSDRRSTRSLDSRAFSLDRRMNEYTLRRETGINEKDSTRMIRSEIFRESRNEIRENVPRLQNTLRRQSSPDRLEGRETTRRSGIPISQAINFKDHSRMDRRLERAASIGSDKRLSDRRVTRSLDSRAFSLDRRMNEYTLRRETGINERDTVRRIRSENSRESRNEIRENNTPLQNALRRQISQSLERRKTTRRSVIPISRAIDSKEQSRMDRRLERAASIGSDKRLSDRMSTRSLDSRAFSLDRRMNEYTLRRETGVNENDSTRRIRSEISRESRNDIRENISQFQNTLRRQISQRLERRETTRRSVIPFSQVIDSKENSRMDRRLERTTPIDSDKHLSDRRSIRSLDSRAFSLDRRMNEYTLRRETGINGSGTVRRIRSENSRESRNEIRENNTPLQNTLRRQSSPPRLERRETTRRSGIPINLAINFKEQSRMDRRLERGASNGSDKRLSDRRSTRSLDSRAFSLDRRMNEYTLRREPGINEKDTVRMIRSEISRESRNEIRENNTPLQNTYRRPSTPARLEGRETTRRSGIPINLAINFKEQSRMDRKLEHATPIDHNKRFSDRSTRSLDSRAFSLNKRMTEHNLRRDIRMQERDISREHIFSLQSTLRQSSLDRRENIQRLPVAIIQPKEFGEQSRMHNRIQRTVSADNEQRLSDRRSVLSFISPDKKVTQSYLRRDSRMRENGISRELLFPRRLKSEVLPASTVRAVPERRRVSLERQFEVSRIKDKLITGNRREEVSNINQRYIQERGAMLNEADSQRMNVRYGQIRSERSLVSTRRNFGKVETEMREERSLDNGKYKSSDRRSRNVLPKNRASRSEQTFELIRVRRYIRDTYSNQSPESYTFHSVLKSSHTNQRIQSDRKLSNSRQQTVNDAALSRVSKTKHHHGTSSDKSQNYDKFQIFSANESALFFPSWIGELICAIKKAVTGSYFEENILKHPKGSGFARIDKNLPGFTNERQILKPDSEIMRKDNGHLLQDFVLGSVVAGYFISSIHLKIRDYRNFICIF